MPPAVLDAMTAFRGELDRQMESQGHRMAGAWLTAVRGLDGEMEALARELSDRAARGLPVRRWDIVRQERYQALAAQMRTQVRQFATVAERETAEAQRLMGRWGVQQSQTLIDVAGGGVQLLGQFDRLPLDAFTRMVGNTGAGTPLGTLLRTLPGDSVTGMTNALVQGMALGWHPTRTAESMRAGASIGLERAILISRTESMRVFRAASQEQYRASNIVTKYRRVAAKSPRTCMSCLMLDGRMYDLAEDMFDHPAGRCVAVPVTGDDYRREEWVTGEQWFRGQPEATQRSMMGPGRFAAWRAGQFDLPDLVTIQDDPIWGKSPAVTALARLGMR